MHMDSGTLHIWNSVQSYKVEVENIIQMCCHPPRTWELKVVCSSKRMAVGNLRYRYLCMPNVSWLKTSSVFSNYSKSRFHRDQHNNNNNKQLIKLFSFSNVCDGENCLRISSLISQSSFFAHHTPTHKHPKSEDWYTQWNPN